MKFIFLTFVVVMSQIVGAKTNLLFGVWRMNSAKCQSGAPVSRPLASTTLEFSPDGLLTSVHSNANVMYGKFRILKGTNIVRLSEGKGRPEDVANSFYFQWTFEAKETELTLSYVATSTVDYCAAGDVVIMSGTRIQM